MQVGVARIAAVVWQAEVGDGEATDALGEFELGFEGWGGGGIGEPGRNGAGSAHEVDVTVGGLPVVAQVGTACQESQGSGEG